MSNIAALVADNLDIWTGAIERKSGAGRGGKRISLYGIERLRALILDLAVRGKLVAQDAGDGAGSELLKVIQLERTALIKAKEITKGKSLAFVSDQPPFTIPPNWAWTQISEIGHDWGQKEPTTDFTYIDVGSINQTIGAVQSPNVVSAREAPSRARKIVRKGTVIYSTVRPYLLNIAIVDQDFEPEPIASTAFAIVHPFSGVEAGFIYRYLRSPAFVSYVESCQTGIAYPAINDRQFFAAWCPLPPLAEQQRIVAKVDQLMALCDALESESVDAISAHQTLVEILLATLMNSSDAADLAANWARLESHFDNLFTTDASIDTLKQTILNLAVRGKLSSSSNWPSKSEKLGQVAKLQNGYAFKSEWFARDGTRLLRNINISHGDLDWNEVVHLPDAMTGDYERFRLAEGDVVLTLDRPFISTGTKVAKVSALDLPALLLQRVGRFQLTKRICADFIYLWVCSPMFAEQIDPGRSNGVPHISSKQVEAAKIFVPEVAEQRRIVAKVDELMALCDTLKSSLSSAAETQRYLADAIVERTAA